MLNFVFLTTSLYTTLLNCFKPAGTAFDLPISKSSKFVFELFNLVGTLTNLLRSSLSTLALEAIKSFSSS